MEIVYNYYDFLTKDISKWTYDDWKVFMNNHIRQEKFSDIDFGIGYCRKYSYSSPIVMDHEFSFSSLNIGKINNIINMLSYIDNIHSWDLAIRTKENKRMGGFNTFKNGICNNYPFILSYLKIVFNNEMMLLTEETSDIFNITMTVRQVMK